MGLAVSTLVSCVVVGWLVVVVGIGVKVGVGVRFFETTDRRKMGKGRRDPESYLPRVGTLKFYTIYLESE